MSNPGSLHTTLDNQLWDSPYGKKNKTTYLSYYFALSLNLNLFVPIELSSKGSVYTVRVDKGPKGEGLHLKVQRAPGTCGQFC